MFDPGWLEEKFPQLLHGRHGRLEGYKQVGRQKAPLVEAVGLARLAGVWEGSDGSDGSDGVWTTVAVVSGGGDDYYGVPEGVVFSLPVRCVAGDWKPVPGLQLSDRLQVSVALMDCDITDMPKFGRKKPRKFPQIRPKLKLVEWT